MTSGVVDLGQVGRKQAVQVGPAVLAASIPDLPDGLIDAQRLVAAILEGVRIVIKEELAQIVSEG